MNSTSSGSFARNDRAIASGAPVDHQPPADLGLDLLPQPLDPGRQLLPGQALLQLVGEGTLLAQPAAP